MNEPNVHMGIVGSSLDECLRLLEERLDELKDAILERSPGIAGAALRVDRTFGEVRSLLDSRNGAPSPVHEEAGDWHPQLETLFQKTQECIDLLREAKAETEARSAALRKKKRALNGYRKCNQMG